MGNQFVAYMDEHHGLGAWVAEKIAEDVFENTASRVDRAKSKAASDADGRKVATAEHSMSLKGPSNRTRRSYGKNAAPAAPAPVPSSKPPNSAGGSKYKTWTSPRTSAADTAAAVIAGHAQVGVYPLYDSSNGFNVETLNTLLDFPQDILTDYPATSNFVLAVPTDLIHQVEQSGFADSFEATKGTRSFQWTSDKQLKYRNRVGTIYGTPDALRQCGAAVAGWKAKGIDVQSLADGTDVYREGLERAAERLDPDREISTCHGADGQQRVSKIKAGNHNTPLIGMIMSFDKAIQHGNPWNHDSDYQLLEKDLIGADPVETIFVATTQKPSTPRVFNDRASADFAALDRFLGKRRKAAASEQAGSPRLVRSASGVEPVGGPWDYGRILYSIPTVGEGVADHSVVLKRLAEQNLSYRTVTLESREGRPMVIAIDVPSGLQAKLKPVMRAVHKLPGAQRLGVFPATSPMVPPEMRPKPSVDSRLKVAVLGAVAILASAAAVAAAIGVSG